MSDTKSSREHWQQIWSTQDPDGVSWAQTRPDTSLDLMSRTDLRKGSCVLDVGAGAGALVEHLLMQGWSNVAVLDISEAALTRAHDRLGALGDDAVWICNDILEWRPLPGLIDLWHDRAAFHFLTEPAQQQAYVQVMKTALSPGGWVIMAGFAPDGPEKCSGLPVCRHDDDALAALLGDELTLVEARNQDHRTPMGKFQKFRWRLFHRK